MDVVDKRHEFEGARRFVTSQSKEKSRADGQIELAVIDDFKVLGWMSRRSNFDLVVASWMTVGVKRDGQFGRWNGSIGTYLDDKLSNPSGSDKLNVLRRGI